MELEDRVEALEHELTALKQELQETLLAIQCAIRKEPVGLNRWRNRAWMLALLNTLVAITLFANIRFYPAGAVDAGASPVVPWLRGLWVVTAFFWLVLQIYPLALLLNADREHSQKVAWRSATALFLSNPGLTLVLTAVALGVAAAGALFPPLWFVVMMVMFAAVCVSTTLYLLQVHRRRTR